MRGGLADAVAIFKELVIGLDGVRADIAMMRTPDGRDRLDEVPEAELAQYENSYRRCYVRGAEGILVALAEKIG